MFLFFLSSYCHLLHQTYSLSLACFPSWYQLPQCNSKPLLSIEQLDRHPLLARTSRLGLRAASLLCGLPGLLWDTPPAARVLEPGVGRGCHTLGSSPSPEIYTVTINKLRTCI